MDTHTRKRALIWLALAALLLAALGWMLRPQGGTGERIIATISVGDQTVRTVDLTAAGDQAFTILEETGLPITFQVRARGIDSYVADAIRVGDGLYDQNYSSGGRALGKITDIEVESTPGTKLADELTDGTTAMFEAEDTVDLLLTVEGRGLVTGRSYSLNRVYDLGINSSRNYCTRQADFTGTVCRIIGAD